MSFPLEQQDGHIVTDASLQFWENTWSRGNTPWQLQQANPLLVKYYDTLFPTDEPSRVLVPLCGKSLDLSYLWSRGHHVTGIEGVADAVPAFMKESGVQLQAVADENGTGLVRHRSSDGRLTIVIADFFDVPHPSLDQAFTHVWDRAAFYALSPEPRRKYVQAIKRMLTADDFRYLLTTIEYDKTLASGPPHAIPYSEVKETFGDFAEIEKLEEANISFQLDKFQDMHVKEVVYLLTKRQKRKN